MDHWPFAFLEIEAESHRFQRQEKIGKNDGRVERKAFDGLKGHLRGQLGGLAHLED